MDEAQIQRIIEAALLASDGPLTVANLTKLFGPGELDEENASKQVREALKVLQEDSSDRGVELKRVASGYRYQVRQELSEWVSRLWDEKPPRYTRALLETLALVAYKQPVTRGDIEQVRGVSVSQNIMRTLVERDWIRVVGQREVPGRPSLYGTTKTFLDYFNLQTLTELPPLAEIRALIEPALVVPDETITVTVQATDDAETQDADADVAAADDTQESVGEGGDLKADDQATVDPESADVVQLHSGAHPSN